MQVQSQAFDVNIDLRGYGGWGDGRSEVQHRVCLCTLGVAFLLAKFLPSTAVGACRSNHRCVCVCVSRLWFIADGVHMQNNHQRNAGIAQGIRVEAFFL